MCESMILHMHGAHEDHIINPKGSDAWRARQTEECVEAHTNVDVVVDLAQLRALLQSRLPLVFGGASVEAAALPWPEGVPGEHEGEGDEGEDAEAEPDEAYDMQGDGDEAGDGAAYTDMCESDDTE